MAGDIAGLWADYLLLDEKNARRRKPESPTTRASNARRAKRAIEAGRLRKGIQALASGGLAPASTAVFQEMLAKHPRSPLPLPVLPPAPPPTITFGEADVVRALRSFPGDSAPGPSCLRANHLKEAVFCPSPVRANKALHAIVGTVNLLCAGKAPPEVIPHLCGATLLAGVKKGGGDIAP